MLTPNRREHWPGWYFTSRSLPLADDKAIAITDGHVTVGSHGGNSSGSAKARFVFGKLKCPKLPPKKTERWPGWSSMSRLLPLANDKAAVVTSDHVTVDSGGNNSSGSAKASQVCLEGIEKYSKCRIRR